MGLPSMVLPSLGSVMGAHVPTKDNSNQNSKDASQQTRASENRSRTWSLPFGFVVLFFGWQYADYLNADNFMNADYFSADYFNADDYFKTVSGCDTLAMYCKIALLLLFIAAVLESLRFPRNEAMRTTPAKVRWVLQLAGDYLLAPLLIFASPEVPELNFQANTRNRRILAKCPALKEFKQMALFRAQNIAYGALMVMDMYGADEKLVRRELLPVKGNGFVALDWWVASDALPPNARLLFVNGTFAGDALNSTTRALCRYFNARGWRCVVMTKRGCGMVMPNVQPDDCTLPWCFGGLDDIVTSIDHVAAAFPHAKICGVGLSTGGGQLRNYVNLTGDACRLAAMVSYDAAYDWVNGFPGLDRRDPFLAKLLADNAGGTFANCGSKAKACVEAAMPFSWGEELTGPVMGLATVVAQLHGYPATREGALEYLQHCTPASYRGCRRPVLELNSFGDNIAGVDQIRLVQERFPAESPYVISAVTKEGAHLIRWEGKFATCWATRVSYEFLDAALSL